MQVMVTGRVSVLFAAAIALTMSGVARADTATPPPSAPAKPEAAQATATNPVEAKSDDTAAAADTPAVVVDDNKVQSLLGKDVTGAKGEKLGQITDILVSHTGEIRAAVIDFGGFLGVGSRKIAVAWPTLHFSQTAITLSLTRDELRVTPEFHQGEPIVIVGAAATSAPPPATAAPAASSPPPATNK